MIGGETQLIEKYFFDTDCLSAFLWVREESILAKLYAGRMILPAQVYDELRKVPHLLMRVDTLKKRGSLSVESIEVGSKEFYDYLQMTTSPEAGMRIIGRGEAAGIAMANSRQEMLTAFKLSYGRSMQLICMLLEKFCPDMSVSDIQNFIYTFFPFMFGIYPYTAVTEKQKIAMKEAGINYVYQTVYELTYGCLVRLLG